jgi:hypothetical protein
MRMHGRRTAFDNDAINVLQRAYHGACWSAGIYPHAHSGDTRATAELRDALAQAVFAVAVTGARDVQTLKADALKRVIFAEVQAEAA